MAAEKVVPASATMKWLKPEPSRYLWNAPIEAQAQLVGRLHLFANPHFERDWHFELRLHSEDVSRLDVRPMRGGHSNPPNRPAKFPGSVPEPEHEHVWIAGLGLRCARPVPGLETSDHRATFEAFCARTHVLTRFEWIRPVAGITWSDDGDSGVSDP